MEDVLHSFVAEVDKQQQITYEDFEQIDELALEELDLKCQMAMLFLKVRRFEQKVGKKLNVEGRDAARFDRRKVKCYAYGEIGHFARECTAKKGEASTRYSAYKKKEVEAGESKALITAIDTSVDWNEHEDATSNSPQISCMASCDDNFGLMGISPQVSTCVCDCDSKYTTLKEAYDDMKPKYNACFIEAATYKEAFKTLEQQKVWFQQNQLAYEEKIRVLSRDLECASNELKFSEKEKARIEFEKSVLQEKLDKEVAKHKEWLVSGDKLSRLLYSSKSVTSEIGLGFKKYVGPEANQYLDKKNHNYSVPINYLKEGEIHAVPGPIRGVFMPTTKTSDFDGSHHLFGKKSKDLPNKSEDSPTIGTPKPISHKFDLPELKETIGIRINDSPDTRSISSNDSNTYVSCSSRDKTSETSSYASCDSKTKSDSPKSSIKISDKSSYKSVDSEVAADEVLSKTASSEDLLFTSFENNSFQCLQNNSISGVYLNNSMFNKTSFGFNKSSKKKKCFVYGSKLHLIKDCDFHEKRMGVSVVNNRPRQKWTNTYSKPSVVPQAKYNVSRMYSTPADWFVPSDRSVSHSRYMNTNRNRFVSQPFYGVNHWYEYNDQIFMGRANWDSAEKSSADCSWTCKRPYNYRESRNNCGSNSSSWVHHNDP